MGPPAGGPARRNTRDERMSIDIAEEAAKETPQPVSGGLGRVCHICTREYAKYTCPKCNAAYCSLVCYKDHSGECTEAFYREHVNEELTQRRATRDEQEKMLEILKREQEEFGTEQDQRDDILEGLHDLDLENLSLDDLTPAQRKDFERAVVDGRLAAAISPSKPWWEERDIIAEAQLNLDEIPELSTLVPGGKASPKLPVHATDLLFAYAYTWRRHNGEWEEEPESAAEMSMQLSGVLSQGTRPEAISAALADCLQRARDPTIFNSTEFTLGTLRDVAKICESGSSMLFALADLHAMHEAALPTAKPKAPRRAVVKKLLFFVSWAKEHGKEVAVELKATVLKESVKQEEAFKSGEIKVQIPQRTI